MTIKIHYTPLTFWGLACLHLLAAIALFCVEIPALLSMWLLLVVILSLITVVRDYGKGSGDRIQFCHFSSQGALLESGKCTMAFQLPREVFLSEFLVLLDFGRPLEAAGVRHARRHQLILLPGSLSRPDYCRLHRYLRFEYQGSRMVSRGGSRISG